MAIDSGSTADQMLAAMRAQFNATVVATGSVATSTTAALMFDEPTDYTGGITLTNGDATITIWICTVPDGSGNIVAIAADNGSFPLLAKESVHLAMGDMSKISTISASGTPRLGWIGTTL